MTVDINRRSFRSRISYSIYGLGVGSFHLEKVSRMVAAARVQARRGRFCVADIVGYKLRSFSTLPEKYVD